MKLFATNEQHSEHAVIDAVLFSAGRCSKAFCGTIYKWGTSYSITDKLYGI